MTAIQSFVNEPFVQLVVITFCSLCAMVYLYEKFIEEKQ